MYSADAAVSSTADAIRNLFVAQGWMPYGKAGDSDFFKQNAILATVDRLVRARAGREDHDPVFESTDFG